MAIKRGSKIEIGTSSASMTDLMFLLLLFLMIATTLINPNALKLLLPQSKNVTNTEKPMTTVSIDAELRYFVEMEPVSPDQLESSLQARLEGIEDPIISLHCDESVPTREIVRVMDIGIKHGYKVVLAVKKI